MRRLHRTNICESSNEKVLINIGHCSCTRIGNHLDISIKAGIMNNDVTNLSFILLKSVMGKGAKHCQTDGSAQMVVVLGIKEMKYVVVVLLDDLVGSLLLFALIRP